MRRILALLVLLLCVAAWGGARQDARAAQDPQSSAPSSASGEQPTFRAGVDLLTIDVTALDADGRPVNDLTAADFSVRVDGESRRLVSADLIRFDEASTGSANAVTITAPLPATRNVAVPRGRQIVIAVDQSEIQPTAITPLLASASQFVDTLTDRDQTAFITFPEPGPRVDFTSDKAKLRAAMQGLVGRGGEVRSFEFNIGLTEALDINEREITALPPINEPFERYPPTIARVIRRNCVRLFAEPPDPAALLECRRTAVSESNLIAGTAKSAAMISLRAILSLVKGLAAIEGPKMLVLISPNLFISNESDVSDLVRMAEMSRTTIHVLAVEPSPDERPPDPLPGFPMPLGADRALRQQGLRAIASPDAFHNVVANGKGVFERIATESSAYYLLGVESRPDDAARDRRKVNVEVARSGVKVRASLAFSRAPAPLRRGPEDIIREALGSGTRLSDVPVALATFAQKEPGSGSKVRVNLSAHIGRPGAPASEVTLGYAIVDTSNAVVATSTNRLRLTRTGSGAADEPLRYGTAVALDPGEYSVRFSVVDQEGRRGSVERPLTVKSMTGSTLTASDLIIGSLPASGRTLTPAIEPRIAGGRLAAYLELHSTAVEDLEWATVEIEVAQGNDGPALAMQDAEVINGPEASWRVASATVDVGTLPPGRYIARARIVLDNDAVAVLTQPFVLLPK